MRLQKFLSQAGVASRRKSEELIKNCRIAVNGKIVTEMGISIDSDKDFVTVDGKTVHISNDYIYIMLNKPINVLSSVSDDRGRVTVIDIIRKRHKEKLYPVGRLDYETTGLIILTNDGDLTNKLTHPKNKIYKTYVAAVNGKIESSTLVKLSNGVVIDGRTTQKASTNLLNYNNGVSIVRISICEGMNRQIRKMFESVGHTVLSLHRERIEKLELGDLKTGEWRYLTKNEKEYLKEL